MTKEGHASDSVIPFPKEPRRKIFLINRGKANLLLQEKLAIQKCFPDEKLSYLRLRFPRKPDTNTDIGSLWDDYRAFCKDNITKERDVILLSGRSAETERWGGIFYLASQLGYAHLLYGKKEGLSQLKRIELLSDLFP
jgi:hypothetical protein